ncbi:Hypp335 [Branchiostoma lanceolatum]|uniref:Hypp335 protein n=1 Tax=Branchiostoma lanceolatum TaxID=7740 RepID=A0A8J9V986_BRALA|nr:Hypp335 [Branchiostoma lanceolatum]
MSGFVVVCLVAAAITSTAGMPLPLKQDLDSSSKKILDVLSQASKYDKLAKFSVNFYQTKDKSLLQNAFDLVDADGDGKLSYDELLYSPYVLSLRVCGNGDNDDDDEQRETNILKCDQQILVHCGNVLVDSIVATDETSVCSAFATHGKCIKDDINKILSNSSACDLNKVIEYQESLAEIVRFYEELSVCSSGFVKGLGDEAKTVELEAEELEEDVKEVIQDESFGGDAWMEGEDMREEEEMEKQDEQMVEDEISQIEQDEAEVKKEEEELKQEAQQNPDDRYLLEEEHELVMEEEEMEEQENEMKKEEEQMKKDEGRLKTEEDQMRKDTTNVPEAECSLDVLRPCVDTFVTSVGSHDPWCDVMDAHLACLQDAKKNCSFSAHIEAYRFGFMDMASAYVEAGLCPSSTFNNLEEDKVFEQLEDLRDGIYNPGKEEEREMEEERMEEEREMERERMEEERNEMMEEEREERMEERMMEEQRMSQEAMMRSEQMGQEDFRQENAKQGGTGRSCGCSLSGRVVLTLAVVVILDLF